MAMLKTLARKFGGCKQIKDYLARNGRAVTFRSSSIELDDGDWDERMNETRQMFGKDKGRKYYHFVISPDPEDGLEGVRFDDAPVLNTSTLGVTREGGIKGALKMLRAVQDDPAQIMMDIYERMVLDEASQRGFASFFDDVLDTPDGAVLWHCTIGKDRAGLAAMLLLHVLGASHEDILRDYEATNRYVASRTEDIMDALATYHLAGKLDKSIQVINAADPRFLQAALDAIDREFGGLDAYVEKALGIPDEKRDALRARYLTADPRG